jgi:hypothetical protein
MIEVFAIIYREARHRHGVIVAAYKGLHGLREWLGASESVRANWLELGRQYDRFWRNR